MSDRKSKNLFIASAVAVVAGSSPNAGAASQRTSVLISNSAVSAITARSSAPSQELSGSAVRAVTQERRRAPSFPSIAAFQRGRHSVAETALTVVLLSGVVTMAGALAQQVLGF